MLTFINFCSVKREKEREGGHETMGGGEKKKEKTIMILILVVLTIRMQHISKMGTNHIICAHHEALNADIRAFHNDLRRNV